MSRRQRQRRRQRRRPSVPSAEPSATAEPTAAPGADPGPDPHAEHGRVERLVAPPGAAGSADACTGNDDNRTFFAKVAAAVDWPVYCAGPARSLVRRRRPVPLAGGGWMRIAYKGPNGARFELLRARSATTPTAACPNGPDAGPAAFGDLAGTLVIARRRPLRRRRRPRGRPELAGDRRRARCRGLQGLRRGPGARRGVDLGASGAQGRFRQHGYGVDRPLHVAAGPRHRRGRPERRRPARRCARSSGSSRRRSSSDRPSGSGMATAQPPAPSRASRSNAMYQPSIRAGDGAAQPATAACPASSASIPAPNWATRAGREHPRLGLVEDLTAEQRGVGFADRRTVDRRDQVRVAASAGHRERHAPDVARWRRLGRVEVAMRVEPGEAQADPRARPTDAGQRSRVRRAVAAEDEQSGIGTGAVEARRRRVPRAGGGMPASAHGSSSVGRGRAPNPGRSPHRRGRARWRPPAPARGQSVEEAAST